MEFQFFGFFFSIILAEPSTPSPIDPSVVTKTSGPAKDSRPIVLLVAGSTVAGSILFLTFIVLCLFMKRRKNAGLHGTLLLSEPFIQSREFSSTHLDLNAPIFLQTPTRTKHTPITFKRRPTVFRSATLRAMAASIRRCTKIAA